MNDQDFTTSFAVDQTAEEAFDAINNVRGWWSELIEGSTDELGEEFIFRHEDVHYSKQKITEFIPGKRVTWLFVDAYLSFTEDKSEWKGTEAIFEVFEKGDKTEVRFTHLGLVPQFECFDACSNGWHYFIDESLQNLITSGKGHPCQT